MKKFTRKLLAGMLASILCVLSVLTPALAGAGDVKDKDIVETFDGAISAGKEICGGFIYSVNGQWTQNSQIKKGDTGKSLELQGDTYLYIWREGRMSLTFDAYFDVIPTQNWDVNAKRDGSDAWVYAMLQINGSEKTFGFNGKTMPAEEDRWYNFYFDWDFTDTHTCSVYVDDVLLNTLDISGHTKLNRIGFGARNWYMDNLIWDADLSDDAPELPEPGEVPDPGDEPEPDVPPVASGDLEEYKKQFIQSMSFYVDFNDYTDVLSSSSLEDGMLVLNQGAGWTLSDVNSDRGDDVYGQSLEIVGEGLVSPVPRLLFYNKAGAGNIHEISFDFCIDETFANGKNMNYTLAHSGGDTWIGGIQIGVNGEVFDNGSDTGKRINLNEWHNVTYFVDCINFRAWHLFDGEQVYSGSVQTHYTRLSRIELTTSNGNIYIDNVRQLRYSMRPEVVSATGAGYTAEVVVSSGMKSDGVDFEGLVTLWSGDEQIDVESVEYVSEEKKFVITTKSPIETCTKYNVMFDSSLISDEGIAFDDNYKYTFTSEANAFDITSLVKNSDGSYTAKLSNKSGKTKTAVMVAVGRDADGSAVSMDMSPCTTVATKAVTIKLTPSGNADSYDIYFIDSWESRISVKKPILPDIVPSDEDADLKTLYNSTNRILTVTGKFGDTSAVPVTLSVAGEAAVTSSEGKISANPFSESLLPEFITIEYTEDGGAFSAQIRLSDDIESGVYYVYADSEANRDYARFIVSNADSPETKAALSECNSSTSVQALTLYLDENIEHLGIDKSVAEGYTDDIAKRIIQNRPSNGYTLEEINDIAYYAIAAAKIEDGETVDGVMKEYARVFECTYEDYSALSIDVAKAFDILISEIIGGKQTVTFANVALVASVRASATNWGKLRDCITENAVALGIDMSKGSKYMKISSSYRGEVFEEMRDIALNATDIAEIASAFDDATDSVYASHKKEGSSTSAGGGKGNSSSSGGSFVSAGAQNQPAPVVPIVAYTDLEGHFAKESIEILSAKKIISGYGDGTFRPDNAVTRAEFAKMIALAFDIKSEKGSGFDDVAKSDWFYESVTALSYEGIILGDGNRFYPINNITRQDAAVIIERALRYAGKTYNSNGSFDDMADVAEYAADAVAAMATAGVIKGNNNLFFPEDYITRGEAAVMIYRAFNIRMEG